MLKGRTITNAQYVSKISKLQEAISQKFQVLGKRKFFFSQGNASSHTAKVTMAKLSEINDLPLFYYQDTSFVSLYWYRKLKSKLVDQSYRANKMATSFSVGHFTGRRENVHKT